MDVQKQIRDNTLELQDFLSDLKSWEQTMKERDKRLRMHANQEEPSSIPPIRSSTSPRIHGNSSASSPFPSLSSSSLKNTPTQPTIAKEQGKGTACQKAKGLQKPLGAAGHTYDSYRDKWDKFDLDAALREADEEETSTLPRGNTSTSKKSSVDQLGRVDKFSNALGSSEPVPDALSEKELGNEFFKEKKFVQAIECYSRSIALRPSAVAYANRAMAYIKIRRYKEAELDCTEAIALDDRFLKAYSRRGLARKEKGNFLAAVEDFEFALRLEPQNKELQKQYKEAKDLFEKNAQATSAHKVPVPIQVTGTPRTTTVESIEAETNILSERKVPEGQQLRTVTPDTASVKIYQRTLTSGAVKRQPSVKLQEDMLSTQAVAARAAVSAMTTLAQNITAPKTSYEFESLWKSFSGDKVAQAELLKSLNPSTLPGLFKDSLTAKILLDIVCRLEQLIPDHAKHAAEILDNITRVPRFNMTAMCLTTKDKARLQEIWDKMLVNTQVSNELHDTLSKLHSKFRL